MYYFPFHLKTSCGLLKGFFWIVIKQIFGKQIFMSNNMLFRWTDEHKKNMKYLQVIQGNQEQWAKKYDVISES